jgi:hypothetical protein
VGVLGGEVCRFYVLEEQASQIGMGSAKIIIKL